MDATQSSLDDTFSNAYIIDMVYGKPVTILCASLSILGTVCIMYSYWRCSEERNTLRQLLLTLSAADCMIAWANLTGSLRGFNQILDAHNISINNMDVCAVPLQGCVAQAFASSFGYLVSCFYTVAIAVYFYMVGVRGLSKGVHNKLILVHVFCWLVPFIITLIAMSMGAYGPGIYASAGPWCWVDSCYLTAVTQIVWMTLDRQGWLMIAYITCPILYYFLWRDIKQQKKRHQRPFASINERLRGKKLAMFRPEDIYFSYTPYILYLLRMWSTIRFIISSVELYQGVFIIMPQMLAKFLFIMQCMGDNAQGLCHFILFCLCDAPIRRKVFSKFRKQKAIISGPQIINSESDTTKLAS